MKTLEQLEQFFKENNYEQVAYFTEPSYVPAIIGMSEDERLIYNYDLMVKFLVDSAGMDELDAMEFIDYNTVRSVPYMGEKPPIIMYGFNK